MRSVRAILLGGMVLIIALAVAGQWVGFQVDMGRRQLTTGHKGVLWSTWPEGAWGLKGVDERLNRGGYFDLPATASFGKVWFVFVPWWLILPVASLPAIGVAMAMRRRQGSRGFPVDLNA